MIYYRVVGQAEHCHSCNKELSYRPITLCLPLQYPMVCLVVAAIAISFYVVDLAISMANRSPDKKGLGTIETIILLIYI